MPDFQPAQVLFGDPAGYSIWDIGHWREHLNFVQALAQQSPVILLPAPDLGAILSGGPTARESMDTHQSIHELLRRYTNVQGTDYTDYRLDEEGEFYSFLNYHEAEHMQIRAVLGLT
jgi:hypothetical protein